MLLCLFLEIGIQKENLKNAFYDTEVAVWKSNPLL